MNQYSRRATSQKTVVFAASDFKFLLMISVVACRFVRRNKGAAWWRVTSWESTELAGRLCFFAIFQRLHARAENPGDGIGRTVCKKIIEQLRGERYGSICCLGLGSVSKFTPPSESRAKPSAKEVSLPSVLPED